MLIDFVFLPGIYS